MEQTKIYQTMMNLLSRHTRPDEKLVRALQKWKATSTCNREGDGGTFNVSLSLILRNT